MTDLRTYLTGLGSSGALIAAVVVAFSAVAGIVAIKGLPESSGSASGGVVLVEADSRDDGGVAGAIASPSAQRRNVDPGPASDGDQVGRGGGESRSAGGIPRPVGPAHSPSEPPGLTPPEPEPPVPGPKPPPNSQPPSQPQPDPKPPRPVPPKGPVGGLVEGADGAAGDIVGFQPGIAEAIVPITGPADGAIGVITNPIPLPDAPVPPGVGAGR